jgi:hypothetical protein
MSTPVIGDIVRVVGNTDREIHEHHAEGRLGCVMGLSTDGLGSPEDPTYDVLLANGRREEFWREELEYHSRSATASKEAAAHE